MTHILAYIAGVLTALCLVWGWVGSQLGSLGDDPTAWGEGSE